MANEKETLGQYEYNGQYRDFVKPDSLLKLRSALRAKAKIQEMIDAHMPDDAAPYREMLATQEGLIQRYVDGLGAFNNSILMKNIAHLLRINMLRLGDLEWMLGISAGYISRTAKENSGKRMSVDIAWKIAKIFNVDFGTLLSVDMEDTKGNTAVLLKFLDKLTRETEDGRVQWNSCGGLMCELDTDLVNCGLVTPEGEDVVYHLDHMNQDMRWVLTGDIYKTEAFGPDGEDLLIVPFSKDDGSLPNYDFLFAWDGSLRHFEDYVGMQWQKMFYTSEDISRSLVDAALKLYNVIEQYEFDAKISPGVRSFIDGYLE